MDKKEKYLEDVRAMAKDMQAFQRKQGMTVTSDEEAEKAVQKLVEAKFGTQTEAGENKAN